MLGHHHILVPHTRAQEHFPWTKVREMYHHIDSGKLGLDWCIPVCTAYVPVHTQTDHTHTSFPIRHHHPCQATQARLASPKLPRFQMVGTFAYCAFHNMHNLKMHDLQNNLNIHQYTHKYVPKCKITCKIIVL